MTDVQIGVEMVSDACKNRYDTAFLIGGDIDQVPSIEVIKRECSDKRIVVVFPPKRTSSELMGTAHAYMHITEELLKQSLLPTEIPISGGYILKCPDSWK